MDGGLGKSWVAKWRNIRNKNTNSDTLNFSINVLNGSHNGQIKGKALMQGDSSVYTSEEVKNCRIVFRLSRNYKKTTITASSECGSYGGAGVYFDGDYLKDAQEKTETLVSLDVLNEIQDPYFRKLVDSTYYRYVDCTQIIDSASKDYDNLKTKVITSAVTGSYRSMAYIIMIDTKLHIWTAVIDVDGVHYFTNSAIYKNKLPKTIDNWRRGLADDTVIYQSNK